MKRFTLSIFVVLLSMAVFSQEGNLKSKSYFRIGTSIPSWKYFGESSKSDWQDTKRFGAEFEMGSIYMLNFIRLAPGMRIGINVDYMSINFHEFDVNRNISFSEYKYIDAMVGSKLGPSFSYSPVKHLTFDIYGKINPVWVGFSTSQYNSDANLPNQTYLGYFGIKYSVGLNIRLAALIMGFEFNPGSMIFKNTSNNLDDYNLSNIDGSEKVKIPCYNVTIGVCF
jgi:hypothetical protein